MDQQPHRWVLVFVAVWMYITLIPILLSTPKKLGFYYLVEVVLRTKVSSGTVRAIADKTENVTSSERDSRSEICAKDPRKTYRIDEYGINV